MAARHRIHFIREQEVIPVAKLTNKDGHTVQTQNPTEIVSLKAQGYREAKPKPKVEEPKQETKK